MTWTTEALATTTRLWGEGFSASEISRLLNASGIKKSRNAVIGKIHRARCAKRATPSRPPVALRRAKAARRNPPRRSTKTARMPKEKPAPCEPLNVSIMDVKPFECRAVVDNSEWGRALMCGNTCAPNSVYCPGHDAMFYTLQDRKRA